MSNTANPDNTDDSEPLSSVIRTVEAIAGQDGVVSATFSIKSVNDGRTTTTVLLMYTDGTSDTITNTDSNNAGSIWQKAQIVALKHSGDLPTGEV